MVTSLKRELNLQLKLWQSSFPTGYISKGDDFDLVIIVSVLTGVEKGGALKENNYLLERETHFLCKKGFPNLVKTGGHLMGLFPFKLLCMITKTEKSVTQDHYSASLVKSRNADQ